RPALPPVRLRKSEVACIRRDRRAGGGRREAARRRARIQGLPPAPHPAAALGGPGEDAEKPLAAGRDYKSCDPRLTVRTIKLFMDGALGSRGAALDAPYSDAPDSRGLYVSPPEEILRISTAALQRGIQVETHAIGDRGNRVVLDQYEKAFAAVPAAVGTRAE